MWARSSSAMQTSVQAGGMASCLILDFSALSRTVRFFKIDIAEASPEAATPQSKIFGFDMNQAKPSAQFLWVLWHSRPSNSQVGLEVQQHSFLDAKARDFGGNQALEKWRVRGVSLGFPDGAIGARSGHVGLPQCADRKLHSHVVHRTDFAEALRTSTAVSRSP